MLLHSFYLYGIIEATLNRLICVCKRKAGPLYFFDSLYKTDFYIEADNSLEILMQQDDLITLIYS